MNENTVALAAIALAATCVTGVIWVMKYSVKQLSRDLKEHTNAALKQVDASKKQREASSEVLIFMKNLNGKLSKATIQTVKEQQVEHQTVKQTEVIQ